MSSAEVEALWASLRRPHHGLSAQLHPNSRDVWLAVDERGRRHLLVDATGTEPGRALISTRGLKADTAEISVEGGPLGIWADVICLDPSLNQTFLAVAEDLVADTASAQTPLEAVERTLRTWRWFWGVDSGSLSEAAALGLFGEMWFLDRWAPFPGAVSAWHGPSGMRHDFATPSVSVEVKAASSHSVGAPRHRIATLDQLSDPDTGDLYLFSIQAIPEPSAANTLTAVVGRVRSRLSARPELLDLLDRRLALAGWSPTVADERRTAYRVAAERLYTVSEGFPRLTRESFAGGVPPGIDDVSYTVDLAVCTQWLVARAPDEAVAALQGLA